MATVTDLQYGALLDALHGVRWVARTPSRRLGSPGAHRSARRGSSAEFAEHREYRPGDDPRRLDWKLLARSGRTYLRLAIEGATMPTELVLDASASMAYPETTLDKWDLARQLCVGLARVAHATGDPVGLRVAGGAAAGRVAAAARSGVVADVCALLTTVAPVGASALAPTITDAARTAGRIVVVSDFLGDAPEIVTALRAFAGRGGEAHVVHIVAAEEIDPVSVSPLVSDPEAPEHRRAFGPAERAAYRAAFATWREEMGDELRRAGAWYHLQVTGADPVERIVRRIAGPAQTGTAA
jgi:uncharacterized protein (DUF58 family)